MMLDVILSPVTRHNPRHITIHPPFPSITLAPKASQAILIDQGKVAITQGYKNGKKENICSSESVRLANSNPNLYEHQI
jgi:hypothetical protein